MYGLLFFLQLTSEDVVHFERARLVQEASRDGQVPLRDLQQTSRLHDCVNPLQDKETASTFDVLELFERSQRVRSECGLGHQENDVDLTGFDAAGYCGRLLKLLALWVALREHAFELNY